MNITGKELFQDCGTGGKLVPIQKIIEAAIGAALGQVLSGPLPLYPNDAAARTDGLPDWQLYRNSGGVQQLQGL